MVCEPPIILLPCSADSLEEAPTEAGFHLDGHIEKVLSKLGDEQQQLRRYSRSFSEPNLAVHFLQAVRSPLSHAVYMLPLQAIEFILHQMICMACITKV